MKNKVRSPRSLGGGMFGQDTNQQMPVGSPTAQNPSMLDNVTPQDFQIGSAADPAQNTAQDVPQAQAPVAAPVYTPPAPMMDINSPQTPASDPFAQNPITTPADQPVVQDQFAAEPVSPFLGTSPSGPVEPPVDPAASASDDHASYMSAITDDAQASTSGADSPVDHDKLADMKRQALEHLEPLADHIDGTAEERFRTTMMMVQANDNHTLLDKALAAAKEITDDKERAQAMLDIINEINYFSQLPKN